MLKLRIAELALLSGWLLAGVAQGQALRVEPQVGPYDPRALAFSPVQAGHLLVVEGDGNVSLWDVEDLQEPVCLRTWYTNAASIALCPDGKFVVGGLDGTVQLFDDEMEWSRETHSGRVWGIGCSRRGIVSGEGDFDLRLSDLDGSPRPRSSLAFPGRARSLAISPGGDVIATGYADGAIVLWDKNGRTRASPVRGHHAAVECLTFSATGDILASGSRDGRIRIWNADSSLRAEVGPGHQKAIRSLAFSPRGDVLVSVSWDRTVRLWNLDGTPRGDPLGRSNEWLHSAAISATGDVLAAADMSGPVQLLGIDGAPMGKLPERPKSGVVSIAFSPTEAMVAVAGYDSEIRQWNLDGSKRAAPLTGHVGLVTSLAFSPDGKVLVSASDSFDATVRLWRLDSHSPGKVLEGHSGLPTAVAASPQGDLVAAGDSDGRIHFWNLDGTRRGKTVEKAPSWIQALAFSPTGAVVASNYLKTTIGLWNLDGSPSPGFLLGHPFPVRALAFSPRGDLLASGDAGGTVRLWNLNEENRASDLPGCWGGEIKSVVFSSSGKLLMAAGAARSCLWKLAEGQPGDVRCLPIHAIGATWLEQAQLFGLASPSGLITFVDSDLRTRVRLLLTKEGGIAWTPDGWFSAPPRLRQQVRVFPAGALSPKELAQRYHRPPEIRIALFGRNGYPAAWTQTPGEAPAIVSWYQDQPLPTKLALCIVATAIVGLLLALAIRASRNWPAEGSSSRR